RLRCPVERIEEAKADAYFATRPRLTQIGTWASKQSAPLESPHAFEKAIAFYAAKFAVGAIPRPPNWTGYRLRPLLIEFWQDRPFRLHDRVELRRQAFAAHWHRARLYPGSGGRARRKPVRPRKRNGAAAVSGFTGTQTALALVKVLGFGLHGDATLEPAAPRPPAHRSEPWHRPCHR